MSDIEHLIGIKRAAGYDEADIRDIVEWLNRHSAVAFAVELTEPATLVEGPAPSAPAEKPIDGQAALL